MIDNNALCTVWLSPDEPAMSQLQARVREISEHYSAPVFQPHVTVLGDLPLTRQVLGQTLAQVAGTLTAPEPAVSGVVSGNSFYQSLYLDLTCPPGLIKIQSDLRQSLPGISAPGEFLPHISMAYGPITPAEKERTRRSLECFIGTRMRFSRLQLVHSNQHMPISDWEVLQEFRLS